MCSDSDLSETSTRCYAAVNEWKASDESEEAHVRLLIGKGEPIPLTILWGAVYWRRPEVVDLLLSVGVDPNRRHARAERIMPRGENDWLDREPDRIPWPDDGAQFPLGIAANIPSDEDQQEKAYRMVRSLLRHGADPYALFTSQLSEGLYSKDSRPLFPGQEISEPIDPTGIGEHQGQRIEDILSPDFRGTLPKVVVTDFGLRSVIHSVLDGGDYFKPFLESPEFMKNLKLEHRDPQGRTLFLSACRNQFGADSPLDEFPHQHTDAEPGLHHESDQPPGVNSGPSVNVKGAQPQTAVEALLDLGADPLATDNQGKNALHQLLEAHLMGGDRPPAIRQTLHYLIARFPSLVNQPDHNGLAPIHTAIRRMWQYSAVSSKDQLLDEFRPPEDCVLDLLETGANVHARDASNNTVIHYLADGFLDAFDGGERRRQLFYMLLDEYQCAQYINSANNLGLTPIQLMLSYTECKDEIHSWEWSSCYWNNLPNMQPVDEELFGKFDELGTDWMVRDKFGRTLLHGVLQVQACMTRVQWRCRYLLQKGVDPMARDFEGKTARDLALERQDSTTLRILEEAEQAAAHGKN
ncbi:hypothetical protein TrVFT333_007128 [Trichoderma virens FT-333]|nr:hypothetical protein TrVFT333_007128 [Trichoderma virens FT-333]